MQENLPPDAHKQTGSMKDYTCIRAIAGMLLSGRIFCSITGMRKNGLIFSDEQPLMIRVETSHYIKGLHYLLNAHFDLRNYRQFEITLKQFEAFAQTSRVKEHDNFRIQAFVYISTAKINQHFMLGTFKEGLKAGSWILKKNSMKMRCSSISTASWY